MLLTALLGPQAGFLSVVLGHMDGDAVAANSITAVAKNLISCLIRGVGGGAGIMIGNLLGANLLDKAKEYGARLTKLSALVGIGTGLLLVAMTPVIMNITQLTPKAADISASIVPFSRSARETRTCALTARTVLIKPMIVPKRPIAGAICAMMANDASRRSRRPISARPLESTDSRRIRSEPCRC